MVSRPDGSVVFESRAEQGLSIDHVNLREKQRFMSGEKVGPAWESEGPGECACTPESLLLSPWAPRVER